MTVANHNMSNFQAIWLMIQLSMAFFIFRIYTDSDDTAILCQ